MDSFIHHARDFHSRITTLDEERERFGKLAQGQAPEVLFITCSDSRVIPSLITGSQPGQLFELRTAGNAVPPYGASDRPDCSGEAATIEYAVSVLQVPDIVVCGHSHCGAVGARVRDEDLAAVPAVDGWLRSQLAEPAELAADHHEKDEPQVSAAVQRHVRAQVERLRGYPCVQRRLEAGDLRLHGWFYAIDTGLVLEHRPDVDAFLPL
ncbi:carbonic anhydrase [Streptomyces sp. HNM0574]|uniref:carbonic anhydrase n=1 Tax=Streptomyces sp. HNM0574 TaxID=2714954 RepID=UPI00146A1EDD|nr:carbonic anhydrase [Streptomyces sp. HNM0574]NLU68113.1 carbonic anhydrase [Streptomyces sp. HNM0574]